MNHSSTSASADVAVSVPVAHLHAALVAVLAKDRLRRIRQLLRAALLRGESVAVSDFPSADQAYVHAVLHEFKQKFALKMFWHYENRDLLAERDIRVRRYQIPEDFLDYCRAREG